LGKTFLLRAIIYELQRKGKKVAITASTGSTPFLFLFVTIVTPHPLFPPHLYSGIAAVPLGGITLHSFAGTGVPVVYNNFDRMYNDVVLER
jgi:hypothetical protein